MNRIASKVTYLVLIGLSFLLLVGQANAQTQPRISQNDLVYQGAFLTPDMNTPGDAGSFAFGGTSLAYNPANDSIFIVGFDHEQLSAEIKIPQIVNTTNIDSLKRATLLQGFRDGTENKLRLINPGDVNSKKIGGHLVWNGKLVMSGFSYYDGDGTQASSHFLRPLNLSTTGQVVGPVKVGDHYPGYVSGYMTNIPSEWQTQFGGPSLTGNCCLAIAGVQSNGPAASVFDPAKIGTTNPVPATPIVGYPESHPLAPYSSTNPLFNGSTNITGIVFPSGTRSVLFFGRHGVGDFCYGAGTDDPAKHQKKLCDGENCCYDPEDDSKGTHGYPYAYQVWAYDANDLLAVKNRTKQEWEVQPYAVWNPTLPFAHGTRTVGGAAYDPATQRIYVSALKGAAGGNPVIHVYKVNVTAPPPGNSNPSSPTNLRVQG